MKNKIKSSKVNIDKFTIEYSLYGDDKEIVVDAFVDDIILNSISVKKILNDNFN